MDRVGGKRVGELREEGHDVERRVRWPPERPLCNEDRERIQRFEVVGGRQWRVM